MYRWRQWSSINNGVIASRSYLTHVVGCRSRAHSCWYLAFTLLHYERAYFSEKNCCCTKHSKSSYRLDNHWGMIALPVKSNSGYLHFLFMESSVYVNFNNNKHVKEENISAISHRCLCYAFHFVLPSTWISEHSSFPGDFLRREIVCYLYSLIFHL